MKKLIPVESLKSGNRFEFVTPRSEWADNCYLPHPKGVIVVAKAAFFDTFKQCRFEYRLEKFPNSKPQDWWGMPSIQVRLLDALPELPVEITKPSVKKKPRQK